uniref:Uncharacterized protein n=1 Tax=Arundo donax TaxID=35708 RepID=A0A0A9HS66_ARUDO
MFGKIIVEMLSLQLKSQLQNENTQEERPCILFFRGEYGSKFMTSITPNFVLYIKQPICRGYEGVGTTNCAAP